MKTIWTHGLSEQQEQELRSEYASSPLLRNRLHAIIQDKMEVSRKNARSKDKYENASWPYLQADAIGYERALSEIISLILTKSVE